MSAASVEQTAAPKACWLDCDPGHDDALALILCAFSPALDLIGVSTVAGNVSVDKTFKNAAHMLHIMGLHETVPLYKGCATPLLRPLNPCPEIHGDSGLGGMDEASTFPPLPADYPWRTEHAVEGMWHCIQMQYYYGTTTPQEGAVKLPEGKRQKVTLIATGAMTNVALLLRTHPEITPMLEAIVLMGGGFSRGNTRPLVEFNMETDPEAASIVFNAGLGHHEAPFGMSHHKAHMLPHDAPGHQGPPAASAKGAPADAAHAKLHGDAAASKPAEQSALAKGFHHQEASVPLADLPKAIASAIGVPVSVPGATAGDPAVSVPVVMLPLEVTHTALVTSAVVDRITKMETPGAVGQGPSRFAKLIASLLMFFKESYAHVEGMPEPPLHDPCAVAAVIDPARFNLIHTHVFVDTHSLVSPGATVADLRNVYRLPRNAKNAYVATGMEVGWFWEQMLTALERANAVCLMNSMPTAAEEQPPAAKKPRAQ